MDALDERLRALEARLHTLGVAKDALPLPLDATIKPGTLAISTANHRLAARPAPVRAPGALPSAGRSASTALSTAKTAAAKSDARTTAPHLPHITLAEHDEGESERETGSPGADLVVGELLGAGGMGAVHSAWQRSLERELAIKRAHAELRADSGIVDEARIMARVEGPHVVPVHALGRHRDGAVLLMKRIEGVSWRTLMREPEHAAWPALIERFGTRLAAHVAILAELADALSLAHARGVVHRDLKPENVLVGAFGEVYLVDWGIARRIDREALDTGDIVGTPGYMAPEMVGTPHLADERTDVYLLGATLHEVLTGSMPHRGDSLFETLAAALASEPKTYGPEVPEDLAALCVRAMDRDPAKRPASAAELRHALAEHERHRTAETLAKKAHEALDRVGSELALASDEAGRALLEARLGMLAALRACPESAPARRGQREVILRAIERELALSAPAAARALLAELEAPPEGLEARIAQLEADAARARDAAEALARRAADEDSSVASRVGQLVVVAISSGSALVRGWLAFEERSVGVAPGAAPVVIADGVAFLALLLTVLATRRTLLQNKASRRLTLNFVTVLGAIAITDLVVWAEGGDAASAARHTMMTLASCFAVGSVFGIGELWMPSAAALLSLGIALMMPGYVLSVQLVGMMAMLGLALIALRRDAERTRHDAPPSVSR